ncbi:hypothetical protein Y032_0577g230 [Ancylostoma ceylanicum]|uniref:Uncharacterized protein n=1 Tax=Ancylostoma ceylanicum TaxID=53326 RepID=A0A016WPK9_9BILA|nr:hypothetical protein Y032_0577g230 [Ancylostoma ceylanicum]
MYHKIMHGESGFSLEDFCKFRYFMTRGGSSKIVVPGARSNCRAQFFTVRAASAYIRLCKSRSTSANVRSFKTLLGKTLRP